MGGHLRLTLSNLRRRTCIVLTTVACLTLPPMMATPQIVTQPAQTNQNWLRPETSIAIDALFARPDGAPGYAVGIINDGQFIFCKGFGLANLDDRIPITPETSFHLASLSKQFTATAIALLVLEQKISLSDSVAKYIPELAKFGPDLRIEHLIYMTSGLPEYTDLPRASGHPWATFYYFTRDEAITAVLKSGKLDFPPALSGPTATSTTCCSRRSWRLSATNLSQFFMQQRIFQPLGMTHSEVDDDTTEVIAHRAIGYAPRSVPSVIQEFASVGVHIKPGEGWARLVRVSPHFGGSGVFTTLNDLLLWDRNWSNGSLAGPGFTSLMNRRQHFRHDKDNDAFGLVWRSRYGHAMLDYSGGDTDTSTYMARFPDQHLTIICLSNMPLGDAEGKANAIMAVLHGSGEL